MPPSSSHNFSPAYQSGIAGYFSRIRIVSLIALILSGAGLASYVTLTKELNPNIQIPIVFVTTVFPGTDPEDMEQLVTIPLDALFTHTNHTSLFIEHDGKAEELTVSIQKIFGNAALLNESLPDGTSVLLNRALISGEAITLAQ